MENIFDNRIYAEYNGRCNARDAKIITSTMNFIQYFIDNGDDKATAENKVSQLSDEVALWIYPYVLGNTQPLIDAINKSTLEFMDASAKAFLINNLSFN